MEKTEILNTIKDTEMKVEKLKNKAIEERENIIKASRRDALKIVDNAKIEAQKNYDSKISQMEEEMEEIKGKMIEDGTKKANELRAKAKLNREMAVDLLIKKFEGEIGDA